MAERELELNRKPAPDNLANQNLVVSDRLAAGQFHFDEAIALLRRSNNAITSDHVVEVAALMKSANVSPKTVLEVLMAQRDSLNDDHYRQTMSMGVAKIYAILGDYTGAMREAESVRGATYIYLFAAEKQIEHGEDPNNMLQVAKGSIEREVNRGLHGGSSVTRTWLNMEVGSIYALAGEEEQARRIFTEIETVVDDSRQQYSQVYQKAIAEGKDNWDAEGDALNATDLFSSDTIYDRLAGVYASRGWFNDALRVAEKLHEDSSHYYEYVVQNITDQQIKKGLIEESVKTARRLGGPLYLKALAHQAIYEADLGRNYQSTTEHIEAILDNKLQDDAYYNYKVDQAKRSVKGGNIFAANAHIASANSPVNEDDYIQIQILLAQASIHAGNIKGAEHHFTKAWETTEAADPINKPSLLLSLASGIDEAGFDSINIYKRVFEGLNNMGELAELQGSPVVDIKWGVWAKTIHELCDKGHLDLAREAMEGFDKSGLKLWERSKLLAYLGAAEVKRGITT